MNYKLNNMLGESKIFSMVTYIQNVCAMPQNIKKKVCTSLRNRRQRQTQLAFLLFGSN